MPDYTILLIDYDPDSAERLRRPLARAGYRVEIATDGLAGISRFDELSPDLTLIEAMIPKKHGFEVCKELKQTPHGQRSAVWILTSVYKGRKYRTQAFFHYKCDEYLEKPIREDELLESVNGYFEERARRAEVSESQEHGAIEEEAQATVVSFDPDRSRARQNETPAAPPPEFLPANEGTCGGGVQSAIVPKMSPPEAEPAPEPAVEPRASEVPDESRRSRMMLWIALALLAALGGLLVVTVLL